MQILKIYRTITSCGNLQSEPSVADVRNDHQFRKATLKKPRIMSRNSEAVIG